MIDLREQRSGTTSVTGGVTIELGPVPLGQSWWIRSVSLDGSTISSALVKAYRVGGLADAPFFLGYANGIPSQGGPILLRSREALRFVITGAVITDKLTLYGDGYRLKQGEALPFSGSVGGALSSGIFFTGSHTHPFSQIIEGIGATQGGTYEIDESTGPPGPTVTYAVQFRGGRILLLAGELPPETISGLFFGRFGAGVDTRLYRHKANGLTTDGDFVAKGWLVTEGAGSGAGVVVINQQALNGKRWDIISATNALHGQPDGTILFYNATDGSVQAYLSPDANILDAETGLVIRRNKAGAFSLQRVSVGAVDSGGVGFKLLRIPN